MLQVADTWSPMTADWRTILAAVAAFGVGLIVRGFLSGPVRSGILVSPRLTILPKLSKEEQLRLPYPPDVLPGARDIETPFGAFRVYEWGPEKGRRVLLVHGISTPCLSLGGVAHALVDRGCRVILFDLPGRGYSDTPTDLQHDARLFTSQILLVLASSPLSWTAAEGGFSLIGYSLGGGICASFASYFPDLVNSLVLIAPAGLIRDYHISRTTRILYSEGVIPEPILNRLVRKRLQKPMYPSKGQPAADEKVGASTAVQAEVNTGNRPQAVLSKSHPGFTLDAAINHQVVNHQGFVQALMSSIRYGPITNQHDRWRRIGKRLSERNQASETKEKVLIILGERDPIIKRSEIEEDAENILEGNVDIHVLPAGHDVPITRPSDTADIIWQHWHKTS